MNIISLALIASGAYLAYTGYKRKFIKTGEGQSLHDLTNEMLNSDPDTVFKKSMGMGCSAYLKVMSILLGIGLMLIGLLAFILF